MAGTIADGVVVDYVTEGIGTTQPGAWITTLLINARLVVVAVSITNAFRLTVDFRVANVIANARADGLSALHTALAVETTWRGHTRGHWWFRRDHILWWERLGNYFAACVRVTFEPRRTEAHRTVRVDFTERVNTTGTRARIDTASVDTSQVVTAVVVYGTFRFAASFRISLPKEARGARAHWVVVGSDGALGVGATRVALTGVARL